MGNVYMSGNFNSVIDLDPTVGVLLDTANGAFDYFLQKYDSSGNYIWTTSGTYNDTLMSTTGCDSIITINLTVSPIDTTVLVNSGTLTANIPGASYQWFVCDSVNSPIAGATDSSFTPTASGNYAVEISKDSCTDSSGCHFVNVVGIENRAVLSGIRVYPNPTNGIVTIESNRTSEKLTVYVRNVLGEMVSTNSFQAFDKTTIELEGASGVYFVQVSSEDGQSAVFKVLKE